MRIFIQQACLLLVLAASLNTNAQGNRERAQQKWMDSVFNSLTPDQRIAQLMVIRAHSNLGPDHIAKVENDIRNYNVGGLCFFQGGPVRQALLTNQYQSIAKTPLMITIDGEWGVGMRLDSVDRLPYQLSLGAVNDPSLSYRIGLAMGEQCKRLGIHVNYAPVVDVNNNPNNPVIGFRSFGSDKEKVARYAVAITKGMQDVGIMACAKHFPGHGDVDVDSHYDLPIISKSLDQLDAVELYPFKKVFEAGIGSAMVAHLSVPAIDTTTNRPTSISKPAISGVLRNRLNFQGLTFTDALEMKGIAKHYPGGTIAVEAIIAGNDMLCLPASVSESIQVIQQAITDGRLTQAEVDAKVKKVLSAKYGLGLNRPQFVDTTNLIADLNERSNELRQEAARRGLTLLRQMPAALRTQLKKEQPRVAYVQLGGKELSVFGKRLQQDWNVAYFHLMYRDSIVKADSILTAVKTKGYDVVLVGLHDYANKPMNNFNISTAATYLGNAFQGDSTLTLLFGNVLAAKNFCSARSLVALQQDDSITNEVAADWLQGDFPARGRLQVNVCEFSLGDGVQQPKGKRSAVQLRKRLVEVDYILEEGLAKKAYPGAVVLAVQRGAILYQKSVGQQAITDSTPIKPEHIFDLASVTKISATTVAVMKLVEEGKLKLSGQLKDYLPWVKGSDKESLNIKDILLHQAGLVPFIPFYKETIDAKGNPDTSLYATVAKKGFTVRVAESLYRRDDWKDTLLSRILKSPLGPQGKYVYSDNDFIFFGLIVEQLTGKTLEQYVQDNFYRPLGMYTTGFTPRRRFPVQSIVPTETETQFRKQTMRGDVHDEGASLFGGVAGHAGLFSNAYDLAMLYQMLLQGGKFNGRRYLKESTIQLFTNYQLENSRRGLGFDKPEKDNQFKKDPYPSLLASPATFGHTGFTGTCVWVDPKQELVYVFLSNRVNPTRTNNLLGQLQIRGRIQDAIYRAIGFDE
jgi:beta-glucosidase-like glycosyl hydrolase/CubicO group peptidase (beta-lactamase class C family)